MERVCVCVLGRLKIDYEKNSPIFIYGTVTILCFMFVLLITQSFGYAIRQKSNFIFVQMGSQLFHLQLSSVSIPNLFEGTLSLYTISTYA